MEVFILVNSIRFYFCCTHGVFGIYSFRSFPQKQFLFGSLPDLQVFRMQGLVVGLKTMGEKKDPKYG
jgi:hypothetical protein